MTMMGDTKYTEDHAWLRFDEDGLVTVGISDYAQSQLGSIVYVELPQPGQTLSPVDEAAIVESDKTTSDFKVPVSGTVVAINEALAETPSLVNRDPLGDGWLFRLSPDEDDLPGDLLSEDAYLEYVGGL